MKALLLAFVASTAFGQAKLAESNGVSLTTSQTISGAKTFSASLTPSGGIGGDLNPTVDQNQNVGSATKSWNYGYFAAIRDQTAGQNRLQFFNGGPNIYNSRLANSGTNVAHQFGNALGATYTGTTRLACFYDGAAASTEKFCIFNDGTPIANGQAVPIVHGAGNTAQAIEVNSSAMTAGELAVTFSTAFGASPKCTCTHVNTTNDNACNIKSGATPSTTAVTFAVASGGTDVVHWICIGQR